MVKFISTLRVLACQQEHQYLVIKLIKSSLDNFPLTPCPLKNPSAGEGAFRATFKHFGMKRTFFPLTCRLCGPGRNRIYWHIHQDRL